MRSSLMLITFIVTCCAFASASVATSQNTDRNLFAADIYQAVATDNLNQNVVISPASIQTSMALAFYGAKGKTATEMQNGFRLGSSNADDVVRRFGDFQKTFTRSNNIRLGNNIYINENLEFKSNFRDIAQRNFDSNIEKADFHPPYNKRTADRISAAIAQKTNNKVTNIISPQVLNDLTEGVIVNGIAYSAPWQKAFKEDKTSRRTFSSGGRQSMQVDTMWTMNNFKYGEFSDLDAKVIELPYQNSDFAMLVVLPNKKDGLRDLVSRLANKNLVALVENGMSTEKLEVYLPKFSYDFGVNLQEPFRKLGVTAMFTRQGDFGNMYRMFVSHYINSADHKAHVEVSETGSERPLESGGLKSLLSRTKTFDVNHPFVFAIKNADSIIFLGHITFNV